MDTKKLTAGNTGYLHWRGRKVYTLSDLRSHVFCLPTEKLPQIRQWQLAPSVRGNLKIKNMFSTGEKLIVEKFVKYYKKNGGTITHDMIYNFKENIRPYNFEITTLINKSIEFGLIKYKFTDRTNWTTLTEFGWNFTTFEKLEETKKQENEIAEITINKLKVDLKNAKRQAIFFYPLTALTIILGLLNIYFSTKSKETSNSLKHLELRVDTTNRVVEDLIDKIDLVRVDTSTRVLSPTKKK